MNKNFKIVAAAAIAFLSLSSFATDQQPPLQSNGCGAAATSCTGSNQNSGDVSTVNNNGDTHSTSAANGNSQSAVTNGNTISGAFDNRAQTTQNATNTTTGTISGGNTNSSATGGSANGNLSNNTNSVGGSNSSSGGNTMNGGANTATTGNNTNTVGGSSSGGNNLTNGSNTATNTAHGGAGGSVAGSGNSANSNTNNVKGGAGGAGGQGGAGGSSGVAGSGNSTNANTASNAQGQGQQQANNGKNAQGQSSANTNQAGGNSGGNSKTGVSTSISGDTYSSYSKTTVWAPVIHSAPAPALVGANISVIPMACGPRVQRRMIDVEGRRFNVLLPDQVVPQGWTEILEEATVDRLVYDPVTGKQKIVQVPQPFLRKNVEGQSWLMGHQVWEKAAVIGVSSGGSFSIGGFGRNGDGGQGGASASGQLQQQVSQYTIRDCVMATAVEPTVAVPPPPAVVEVLPLVPDPGQ